MSTVKPLYGSNTQTLAATLASLGSAAYHTSAVFNNTSTLFQDVRFQLLWKNGASVGGTASSNIVNVYLVESVDGGTTYSDNATANAAFTPTAGLNMKLLYTLNAPVASTQYRGDVFTIVGGGPMIVLPDFFMLVVFNNTGGTADATAGNFSITYEGVNLQVV
jgi:hypothetical protein